MSQVMLRKRSTIITPEFRKSRLYEAQSKGIAASFVRGDTCTANQIIEANKENYTAKTDNGYKTILAARRNNLPDDIDISWLPAASQTYDISPNIDDYLVTDVSAVTIDIPNRNLQGFPFEEITYFDSAHGKMVGQTFVGKPSCKDHANEVDQDSDLAKGVIFGVTFQHIPDFNIYKIRVVQGWDRTKDSRLCNDILSGKRKYYSMGALVSAFICPVCGSVESSTSPCQCMKAGKGSVWQGHLLYSLCLGACFIENSSVVEPADPTAEGEVIE